MNMLQPPEAARSQSRRASTSRTVLDGFERGLFDELAVAVLCFAGSSLIEANAEWTTISGLTVQQSMGSGWLAAVHSDDRDDAAACAVFRVDGAAVVSDIRLVSDGGFDCWFRAVGRTFDDAATDGEGGVVTMTAVGAHRSAEARLLHMSTHDGLTGLVTRAKFVSVVENWLGRHGGPSGLLFIDLDHFKIVNDQMGHRFGDELLQAVGKRVESAIRATDIAGRLGGDEIGVFCSRVGSVGEAIALAERVGDALAAPFTVADHTVVVGSSIGIALTDGSLQTAEELIDGADRAMYSAKADGGGRWALATTTPRAHASALRRPAELAAAIDGRIAVAQAIGMIAQRSGNGADDSAAMLRTYASASNVGVVSAARLIVTRGIDIDAVTTVEAPSPAVPDAVQPTVSSARRSNARQLPALSRFYLEHSAAVFGCAHFICGHKAGVVTEQTFVAFWLQTDDETDGSASARVRLLTIAHRLAVRAALTNERAVHTHSPGELEELSRMMTAAIARGQVIERTLACAHLSTDERSMAAMMVYGRCSYTEVARLLGEPADDVRLQLRGAQRRLRESVAAASE
jgi:diguanylate cyclase (GGDEF)-like protein